MGEKEKQTEKKNNIIKRFFKKLGNATMREYLILILLLLMWVIIAFFLMYRINVWEEGDKLYHIREELSITIVILGILSVCALIVFCVFMVFEYIRQKERIQLQRDTITELAQELEKLKNR